MVAQGDLRVLKLLQESIERELNRVGLLFRVFSRSKSERSIEQKINRSPGKYSAEGRKIQDLFGIRVALYFSDDLEIAQKALKNKFVFEADASTIDTPSDETFSANRCNFIFRIDEELADLSDTLKNHKLVDSTFEVQFRTVLSEGWHEVEHDLRYKCSDEWPRHKDLSRSLNGIYAVLETSDWGMLSIFEELCHRNYRNKEWKSMLRNKFRLRFQNDLNDEIFRIFSEDNNLAKAFFRINRSAYLSWVLESGLDIPINLSNVVYASNFKFVKCQKIDKITPTPIMNRLHELRQ